MRKTAFVAAALAAALSVGIVANGAAAMPRATPIELGLAAADGGLVQKTAVVGGRPGCRRVVRESNRNWVGRWAWGSNPAFWGWSSGPCWGWSRSGWGWNTW